MKPLNIDKTGCSNMSSNCVVWQGPDIECINLCKGDSVTEVVYKLALELCNLMDTFNLSNYDLKCFSSGVCQPKDFKDFINILITKVCSLQECTGCGDACNPCPTPTTPTTNGGTGTSNPEVPIAPAFYYTNAFGDTVTTMTLTDYVNTIGNKVATNISEIQILNATVADHEARITNLENTPPPSVSLPQIVVDGTSTDMAVALQTVVTEFDQLVSATGSPNDIYAAIQAEPAGLSSARSLSQPLSTMGSLPGWVTTVTNQADTVNNLWITISDIRNAVANLISNYIPSACSAISIALTGVYDSATNNITLYFTGTIPGAFNNVNPLGTIITVADAYGNSTTFTLDIKTVINNISGTTFSLASTSLNTSGNLFVSCTPDFINTSTGAECTSTVQYTIVNAAVCPSVSYTPTATTIAYTFTSSATASTYIVKLYDLVHGSPIATQSFVTTGVQTINGLFTGLTGATPYKIQIEIAIGGVVTTCPMEAITTL